MKRHLLTFITLLAAAPLTAGEKKIPNKLIDYQGFMKTAEQVGKLRESRRITEAEFIKLSGEPNTVIYDARSKDKYDMVHIKGAIHLSLTDVTADDLAKVLPDKSARILIYCNNNFLNEPVAFASKCAITSLNIYTFNTLHAYGYTNVYELGPLLDIQKTKLPLEGTRVKVVK